MQMGVLLRYAAVSPSHFYHCQKSHTTNLVAAHCLGAMVSDSASCGLGTARRRDLLLGLLKVCRSVAGLSVQLSAELVVERLTFVDLIGVYSNVMGYVLRRRVTFLFYFVFCEKFEKRENSYLINQSLFN